MPVVTNKLDTYNALTHATATRLAGHSREWMQFLKITSARHYKYSFSDQVLIYAQRPEATACAEFDIWKRQMGRYVRGGSKGIALVRRSHGVANSVRYVFDIADTGAGKDSRRPFLWQYQSEHHRDVAMALEKRFEVLGEENLAGQIVRIALRLADIYCQDSSRGIQREMQDSIIMGSYDEDNLRLIFRNALVASISYAVLSRCGVDLSELFAEEDFQCLADFDSNEAITALGTAVNAIVGEVLRVIEDAIREYELKKLLDRAAERQAAPTPEPTIKTSETANALTSPAPDVPMKEKEPEPGPPAQNNAEPLQLHTEQPETDAETPVAEMRTADTAETSVEAVQSVDTSETSAEETQPETIAETSVAETQSVDTEGKSPDHLTFLVWNHHITDDSLGVGGEKAKYQCNVTAIRILKQLEAKGFPATLEEQEILSRYVGWGGIPDVFAPDKAEWAKEYAELKEVLTAEEYASARASVLNAHYTSPTVIRAIYDAIGNMGFKSGNILEPSCGIGNFFGCLPESMDDSKLYGVELDSISGRIAKLLYPLANISICGYEKTDFQRDFFDLAVGNVPFGDYKVNDSAYDKLGFSVHNYFLAKTIDRLRSGGILACVTSRYTMDAKAPKARQYLAERADLLGAIRLPNSAFKASAGTNVVADILFLQKRETPRTEMPGWAEAVADQDGCAVNGYFREHPEMVLGTQALESTRYGEDYTVLPISGADLAAQLQEAISHIHGRYQAAVADGLEEGEKNGEAIPADPDVKNFSYALVDGKVYYRENSVMTRLSLNATAEARIKGMVGLRDCVRRLIEIQMYESGEAEIHATQQELNALYDSYTGTYGLINDRANRLAFDKDSSYYLLCSLEILDEDGNLERKADMFTKRTIRQHKTATHVDTAAEALVVSIGERARVDLTYMASLTGKPETELINDLQGVIYKDPQAADSPLEGWQTADEYLSGNVRRKLRIARAAALKDPAFEVNVAALESAQPKDLEASEIEVRLGATWIDKGYYQQFMQETLHTPVYLRNAIRVQYSPHTAEWFISNKTSISGNDVVAYTTYGTKRANAYCILEDSLNLRDVRIYDTVTDADGKEKRVLNAKETTLAAQKQQAIRDAFQTWIWKDPERRQTLVQLYNEKFNCIRTREYNGSHIVFSGMNPEITLQSHQVNAIAHVLYGGNTLLAHEVGAGKTFEMIASAMESKRLGLCHKSIFVVPNHLTEQTASEFLRLYPAANILVTTKRDFETAKRKKFCARIATGDYDAVIIGHSQFERIPVSVERQERLLMDQIDNITEGIAEVKASRGERFTIKQLEKTRKGLQVKLEKLQASYKKDDVVTFEQLGVDRMFVDESDSYKNLFLYTKMRNVAGRSTADAQKSSDMFAKCRYLDEITGNRGTIFATGTPICTHYL